MAPWNGPNKTMYLSIGIFSTIRCLCEEIYITVIISSPTLATMANSVCQSVTDRFLAHLLAMMKWQLVIHDKHAGACASGITTNPNDHGGTVTWRPAGTTVGTTRGRVLSFTSRRIRPETDTNLK